MIGDKLVCVKPGDPANGLVKDNIYTEIDSYISNMDEEVTEVLEARPKKPLIGYLSWRFRKATPEDLLKLQKEELSTI